ncbi:MAG TPA: 50S ribosomal protein L31 [Candidatus Woesebacteria bacterium]|nr:50S ribosomal protein L31 [Candidatus Woesebacteria bacterium]
MKQNLHPEYMETTITCACGNTFTVGGTVSTLHVDVCNKCHPFFTGTQRFIDAMGRVDKFIAKRQAASGYVKRGKDKKESNETPQTLREMLDAKKKAEAKAEEKSAE